MPRRCRDGSKAAAPNKHKLTDLSVRRLAKRDRPYMVWDSFQRGLAVRVEPTGHKSWKCVYPFHGRPRWYSIAAVDAIGLTEARRLAGRIMYQVAEGTDPAAERKAERGKGTFEELAGYYVEQYAKKNNKSWVQADKLVKKHLLPKWGKLQAADISRADVKARMTAITAPVVANQVLAAASAIFSWAIKEDLLKINPCAKVDRNKTVSRERILSDRELSLFWKQFDQQGLLQSTALKIILLTGQRPGEVSHMHRDHIEGDWWTLPGEPIPALDWPGTKNAVSHRVFLTAPVQALLAELEGYEGAVFKRLGHLPEAMRDICERLGINDRATPHDLRRTFSSKVTGLGYGRDAMNRLTNHVSGGIESVYDRYTYAEENRKIWQAVAANILSQVTP